MSISSQSYEEPSSTNAEGQSELFQQLVASINESASINRNQVNDGGVVINEDTASTTMENCLPQNAELLSSKIPSDQQQHQQQQQLDQQQGVVEMSPNKRYIRFEGYTSVSSSSIQSSFKAFDTKNGIEITWHKINLNSLEEVEQSRVTQCVNTVKKIQSKYVIEFLDSWFSKESRTLNIITTHLETLREFISKVKTLRWKIVKKWCRRILKGLKLLHGSSPEIVHRNLTCSHIYIDGGVGTINIGDMWLAAVLSSDADRSVTASDNVTKHYEKGSSAYLAPELLLSSATDITTKVDIYSFGMCVLELIAREEPYSECKGSVSELIRHVRARIHPCTLRRISSKRARDFIALCLLPADERPTAAELLQHEFLDIVAADDEEVKLDPISEDSDGQEQPLGSNFATLNRNRAPSASESFLSAAVAVVVAGSSTQKQGAEETGSFISSLNDVSHISLTASSLLQHNAGKSDIPSTNTSVVNDYNSKLMDSPNSVGHGTSYSANSTDGSVYNKFHQTIEEKRRAKFDEELGSIDQRENMQLDKGLHDGRHVEEGDADDSYMGAAYESSKTAKDREIMTAISKSVSYPDVNKLAVSVSGTSPSNSNDSESSRILSSSGMIMKIRPSLDGRVAGASLPVLSPNSVRVSVLRNGSLGSLEDLNNENEPGSSNHQSFSSKNGGTGFILHHNINMVEGKGAYLFNTEKHVWASSNPNFNASEVQLHIHIPWEMFRDKTVQSDKEVEFSFDLNRDNFTVVASEMIAELGLDMSVDILAKELEILLKSTSASVPKSIETKETEKGKQEGDDSSNSQTPLPIPLLLPPLLESSAADVGRSARITVEATAAPVAYIADQSPIVSKPSDIDQPVVVITAPLIPDHTAAVKDLPASILYDVPVSHSVDEPIEVPLIVPATAEQQPLPVEERIIESLASIDDSQDAVQCGPAVVSLVEEENKFSSSITIVSPSESDSSATTMPIETSQDKDIVPLPSDENVLSARPPSVAEPITLFPSDEPQPGGPPGNSLLETTQKQQQQSNPLEDSKSNAKDASDSDEASNIEETLQKELEKIDQESRVARRAFENRITKHITIQEKCQEDFLKLEQDFEQKKQELSRKIESSAKKLIDDTAKLKSDRDKRLEVLRLQIRASIEESIGDPSPS